MSIGNATQCQQCGRWLAGYEICSCSYWQNGQKVKSFSAYPSAKDIAKEVKEAMGSAFLSPPDGTTCVICGETDLDEIKNGAFMPEDSEHNGDWICSKCLCKCVDHVISACKYVVLQGENE